MSSAHPFSDFDFSQLKQSADDFDNPIAQFLAKRLLFCKSADGHFSPIDFPTGIGKTYNTMFVLLEFLLYKILIQLHPDTNCDKLQHLSFMPIYLTNSVDNVRDAFEKLHSLIRADNRLTTDQQNWLIDQILLLPSNSNHLLKLIETDRIKDILSDLGIHPSKPLLDNFKNINIWCSIINSMESDANKGAAVTMLQNLLERTFSAIHNTISNSEHLQKSLLSKSQQRALSELYPALRIENSQALAVFMTTMKLLHGAKLPFDSRYSFDQNIYRHLLLIDEIDRQNDEITSFLCKQSSVDLLKLAQELCSKLPIFEPPRLPIYQGVNEIFQAYYQKLLPISNRYRLTYSFRLHEKLTNQHTPALFTDFYTTHFSSINQMLWVYFDDESQSNVIFDQQCFAPDSLPDHHYPLYELFNLLTKLVARDFVYALQNACRRLAANSADKHLDDKSLFDEDLLENLDFYLYRQRLLKFYHLDTVDELIEPLLDLHHKKRSSTTIKDGSFHTAGFALTQILTPLNTRDFVSFHTTQFDGSPTAMLARWIDSGAGIIGISATANNQSVVHNFDIDYLKRRIGDKFLIAQDDEKIAIQTHYNQLRNYQQIKLDYQAITGNALQFVRTHCSRLLDTVMPPNRLDERLVVQIGKKLLYGNNIDDDRSKNDKTRQIIHYLTLLDGYQQAIQAFVNQHHAGSRYMMLMLNRFLNTEEQRCLKDFVKQIQSQANHKIHLHFVNANYLKSNKFNQNIKNILTNPTDKVIVFTTYQTLSSGANPDYRLHADDTDWICTSILANDEPTCDIDTMYLDSPTHLISTPSPDDEHPHSSRLKSLVQAMTLKDAGKISQDACNDWVKNILKGNAKSSQTIKANCYSAKNNANGDFIHALCRQVEQAIGRMNRSAYKRKNPLILYAEELGVRLAHAPMPSHITTHEYLGLITHCHQYTPPSAVQDYTRLRLQTRASNSTIKHHAWINKHLQQFSRIWQGELTGKQAQQYIHQWHALRDICLTHPTNITPDKTLYQYYLELPEPAGEYTYLGNLDKDTITGEQFFCDDKNAQSISANSTRLTTLMQNEIIKAYFEKHGYATTWQDDAKFILTPILVNNIYKGALGEVACKAILEAHGCQFLPMPDEYFELFDAIIMHGDKMAFIDFKHWDIDGYLAQTQSQREQDLAHLQQKLEFIAQHIHPSPDAQDLPTRLIVCNTLADINKSTHSHLDGRILTIAALLDERTGNTNPLAVAEILHFLQK